MPLRFQIGLITTLLVVGLAITTPLATGTAEPGQVPYSTHKLDALLDSMRDAQVDTASSKIDLRGVASSGDEWTRLLSQFRASVADDVHLSMDVFVVDTSLSLLDLCTRIFSRITAVGVNFRQSDTTLRTASYATLDRLVDFARDCSHLTIRITGHSDTSGNESSNKRLSRARAQAVADYLSARGVNEDSLSVVGAGSEFPIADNATPQGRERNRRIVFELLQPQ